MAKKPEFMNVEVRVYNNKQYEGLEGIGGLILEYAGNNGKNTGTGYLGDSFAVTQVNQKEFIKVLRNLMTLHWYVQEKEAELRQYNDGIRSVIRTKTPVRIKLCNKEGRVVKVYDLSKSVWAKIGLTPTKEDLKRVKEGRDRKSYIHEATIKTLEALDFRVEIPKEEVAGTKKKTPKTSKPRVKAQDINPPASEVPAEAA